MAGEKATLEKLLSYTANGSISSAPVNLQLSLVKDPYSGKYYGSETYAELQSKLNQGRQLFSDQLKTYSQGMGAIGGNAPVPNSITGTGVNPVKFATQALETINAFKVPDEGMYVQKPMMVESFNKNPDAWNKFFEGSYKNPRIAEANSVATGVSQDSLVNSAAESIRKKAISTVGTGISTAGTLNPFGNIDSGLGI